MAGSLAAAVRGVGLGDVEVASVARVFALAMEPRLVSHQNDHHPAYLHPGRSVLVLLHDTRVVDVSVAVVAALHDSVDAAFRVPSERVERELGPAVNKALRTIPLPGSEGLVERLVTLGPGLALAALAERLDHLRHLHLREDLMDSWAECYDEVLGAWLPFAQRTHPRLATRYGHWARVFVKRIQ